MAHIPDGVLSPPVLAAGALASAVGVGYGLKNLDHACIPRVAMLAAVLFVASLVHLPAGPASVHLLLNGLAGILLGRAAFPALLVALLLQALLFGFGGLLSLGVNAADTGLPALLAGLLFRLGSTRLGRAQAGRLAAAAAVVAVLGTSVLTALALALSGQGFSATAGVVLVAHAPVMVVEAAFTAAAVSLLVRVKPELLEGLR